jgi:hypothetical protein
LLNTPVKKPGFLGKRTGENPILVFFKPGFLFLDEKTGL